MALNDRSLGAARGVDMHPGVANPTTSSMNSDPLATNFVNDPTTDDLGAGAPSNFQGHEQAQRNFKQTAGVVEGRPGIIETTNIDPLNENSNKEDGWANATRQPGSTTAAAGGVVNSAVDMASGAATMASGAARMAYGHATGDEQLKQAGKEQVWGKQ